MHTRVVRKKAAYVIGWLGLLVASAALWIAERFDPDVRY